MASSPPVQVGVTFPDHRDDAEPEVLLLRLRKCHSEELITTATEVYVAGTSRRKRWRLPHSRHCRVGSSRRQPTHLADRRQIKPIKQHINKKKTKNPGCPQVIHTLHMIMIMTMMMLIMMVVVPIMMMVVMIQYWG